jgi:hypothetical protein
MPPKRTNKTSKKGPRVKLTLVPKKQIKRKKKRSKKNSKSSITPAGQAFLKIATSPCDFSLGSANFMGIPDSYDGNVVTDTQTSCNSFVPTSGVDNYIILIPTPGVAYWYGSRATGTTGAITWTAVTYDDALTLFPFGAEDSVVNAFRYASQAIEVVNLTNAMTWSGAVEIWKFPVKEAMATQEYTDHLTNNTFLGVPFIEGLTSTGSLRPDVVFPLKDGCFCPSFNLDALHAWTSVRTSFPYGDLTINQSYAEATDAIYGFNNITNLNYVGLGFQEAVCIKLPATAASQNLMIRTWATLELQVPRTSILWNYSHFSPPADPNALALLHAFHKNFVGAVTSKENATFWENIMLWGKRLSGVFKHIPGPVGTIAGLSHDLLDTLGDVSTTGKHELW